MRSAAVTVEETRQVVDVVNRNGNGKARLVVVEGKGHEIYLERAGECLCTLMAFVEEIDGERDNGEIY